MIYTYKETILLSDLYTPVGCYLKLRQKYHQILLLESSDYSSKENSRSFLCLQPLEKIELDRESRLSITNQSGKTTEKIDAQAFIPALNRFKDNIQCVPSGDTVGLFGYTFYEAIQYFDSIPLDKNKEAYDLPIARYELYRFTISFDHHHNELKIIELIPDGEESQTQNLLELLNYKDHQTYRFRCTGEEESNISPDQYKDNIRTAKEHLQRGDIFQIVLSRRFSQKYTGDTFNVYRTLRSINPSPYLYYFEYGDYRIFGSSPEAQLVINDTTAEIHPIAGTFRRTGDQKIDEEKAEELKEDPKENAEHVMLVDLARNDLSKHAHSVTVKKYKEVQYFSHVIHLTSLVEGKLRDKTEALNIYADTFPAGTLSGAPKYRAMEIIDNLETTHRGYYGGAIGMIGLGGNINHAILIRSFLAYKNTLYYQAGAGIVMDSDPASELQEVNNKLGALKLAIKKAEEI